MTAELLRRVRADDRGDGDVVALMFLAPLAMGVVMLLIFVGRQASSLEAVTHAAQVAARSASLQRDIGSASAAARGAAESTLLAAGTACEGGPLVSVTSLHWAPGEPIEVTVTCQVTSVDLEAIAAPTRSFTSTGRAVIDSYRSFGS